MKAISSQEITNSNKKGSDMQKSSAKGAGIPGLLIFYPVSLSGSVTGDFISTVPRRVHF
jgi:hypothetical protein